MAYTGKRAIKLPSSPELAKKLAAAAAKGKQETLARAKNRVRARLQAKFREDVIEAIVQEYDMNSRLGRFAKSVKK